MAYQSLPDILIQVGKSLKREIFKTYIKDNLDDHETRLQSLEAQAASQVVFDFPITNATSANSFTGLTAWRSPYNFTLTDCKVSIFEKGILTGTLEVNVRKSSSTDDSAAVSVFSTRPSITYADASDFDESNNAVLDPNNQDVSTGDYLFLDASELPTNGVVSKFVIYLIGEV